MKEKLYPSITALLIFLCGAFTHNTFADTAPSEEENIVRQLNELRHGLEDGIQHKDLEKMISFTHPDIIVTWQNGEVSHGTAEVQKFLERMLVGPESVLTKIVMQPMLVEGRTILGDMVISYGKMEEEYFMRSGDLHFMLNSRFSAWLVKENGKFLLRGLHLSANIFNNPIQDLMVQKARWTYGIIGLLSGFLLGYLLSRAASHRVK